jgi:hypothetical protein
MFFDQLDRQFVPTGAHFDLTSWLKFLSYDTMGLMTFSRPYGYVQHGRDLHGIMDDVKRANLIIGPVSYTLRTTFTLDKTQLLADDADTMARLALA